MRERSARIGWGATVVVTGGFVALVVAPPFIGEGPRLVVMAAFSAVCHQLPARSPHWMDVQFAVCDRCLGIYAALFIASVFFPVLARWRRFVHHHAALFVLAGVLVPGIDWAADAIGLWETTPTWRFATGTVFGAVAGFLLTAAAIQLASPRTAAYEPSAPCEMPG